MKLKHLHLSTILDPYNIGLTLVIIILLTNMANAYEYSFVLNSYIIEIIKLGIIIVGILMGVLTIGRTKKLNKIICISFLFYLFSLISTLINYQLQLIDIYNVLVYQSFCLCTFFCFYFFYNPKKNYRFTIFLMVATILLMSIMFINSKKNPLFTPTAGSINSIYYILLLLPFTLLINNKYIKFGLIILISFDVFLSNKRTAFIILLASIIMYFIHNMWLNKKSIKHITFTLISISILVYFILQIYLIVVNRFDINLLDRLETIVTDGGSGRVDIYIDIIEKLLKIPLHLLLFGFGHNGAVNGLGMYLSAHNDFLEVICSYGLIGFTMYMSLIIMLLKHAFKLIKSKSAFSPAYNSSLIIFLGMSMSSALILVPTYFTFILLLWAITLRETQ